MLETLRSTVALENHELILVDDASTDGTASYFNSLPDTVTVIRNDVNEGFSVSNNLAAKRARGRYLLFLNNDLQLTPGWLEPMLQLAESQSQAGAVGNIQRNIKTGLVDHAGIFFDLEGMPTHAWKNRKRLPPGDWSERNAITAACLLIKRTVFESMNGFDEDYRNGMEDVDLCVRLKKKGFQLYVSHKSVILHHISSSPSRHLLNAQNTALFKRRWSNSMAEIGKHEWPAEYFHRYARYWWRMEPRKFLKALRLLMSGR